MFDTISEIFLVLLVMAYQVLLVALALWALIGRLPFALKKGFTPALVEVLRTSRILQWQGKGLKLSANSPTRTTGALPKSRSLSGHP